MANEEIVARDIDDASLIFSTAVVYFSSEYILLCLCARCHHTQPHLSQNSIQTRDILYHSERLVFGAPIFKLYVYKYYLKKKREPWWRKSGYFGRDSIVRYLLWKIGKIHRVRFWRSSRSTRQLTATSLPSTAPPYS